MLFNSLQFLFFFPTVTVLYFALPYRFRWAMLLLASCWFYMAFVPVYILILLLTILVDYYAAIVIESCSGRKRKVYLLASIIVTCLILFFFKYYNFFIANINYVSHNFGWNYSLDLLKIVLPIGLSFHTFQSLSYVIEVYRGNQKAEKHFGIYALYVMFYPQLVAGPIERPQNLLHQFHEKHRFNYQDVTDGLKLMAWGFFKKLVIADRLAVMVNEVYDNPYEYQGFPLIIATVFFTFQIYCDFSGYSDIARGSAQVMGFRLMRNFNHPYFAKSISDFWSRWHISLSTWFKDYVYIPLGGNRVVKWRWYYNLFIVFLISGFWHGAKWTFIVWGALHGTYLLVENIWRDQRQRFFRKRENSPALRFLKMIFTFSLVAFAWVFFRANNIGQAKYIVTHLFSSIGEQLKSLSHTSSSFFEKNILLGQSAAEVMITLLAIVFMIMVQFVQRRTPLPQTFNVRPMWFRWSVYFFLVFSILMFGNFDVKEFIYFQF